MRLHYKETHLIYKGRWEFYKLRYSWHIKQFFKIANNDLFIGKLRKI